MTGSPTTTNGVVQSIRTALQKLPSASITLLRKSVAALANVPGNLMRSAIRRLVSNGEATWGARRVALKRKVARKKKAPITTRGTKRNKRTVQLVVKTKPKRSSKSKSKLVHRLKKKKTKPNSKSNKSQQIFCLDINILESEWTKDRFFKLSDSESEEFKKVYSLFDPPDDVTVTGIRRVQNRKSWSTFAANTGHLADHCWLWHGTPSTNVDSIVEKGFSTASVRNGRAFGNGVYFNALARVSLLYSESDATGARSIILCQVATGATVDDENLVDLFPRPANYDCYIRWPMHVIYNVKHIFPAYVVDFAFPAPMSA